VFLDEIQGFANMPHPFKGFVRITSASQSDLAIVGLRGRTNGRGDFIVSTTSPTMETSPVSSPKIVFPHIVDGGGYTTEFILYGAGNISLHAQSGDNLAINLQ
jgi:hypothetical protein